MKNLIKKHKKISALVIVVAVVFAGIFAVSHLVYHRSIMATFSEWAMIIVDRDKIYEEGPEYEANLKFRKKDNIKEHTIPSGVKMDVEYHSEFEHYMQVIYFNEESFSDTLIIYIPGGGYVNNPLKFHWKIINTLAKETNNPVLMPVYPKLPNYSCEASYVAMKEFYLDVASREGVKRIIFAGDSSGGGMSLALAQLLRDEHPDVLQPSDLILIAPWMDVSMENDEIPHYEPIDPMLDIYGAKDLGEKWAGKRGVKDPLASPIYGTFENLGKITMFIGTNDMLCPDVLKFSEMLNEQDIEHTLLVKESLDHPYPLFPTPEAAEAQQVMINVINGK